jgi:hypothetical protein
VKLCECGCGLPAPIAPQTDRRWGHIKGQPVHFLPGHNGRRQDLRADFYALVDKNGPTISPDLGQCWLWLGYRDEDGYGRIKVNGRMRMAHHVSLEFEGYYMIPEAFGKKQVGHFCDNPPCVRVSHLKIWERQDDAGDKVSKGRQARVHGERNGRAVLTEALVREIRSLYQRGVRGRGQVALARRFGVSDAIIGRIVRSEAWKEQ